MRSLSIAVAGAAFALAQSAMCADWPQYRGANHDGTCTEQLLQKWPAQVREVWRTATPDGFSTFAVADGVAATLIRRDGKETCLALDAVTGKELWATPVGEAKYDGGGDDGAEGNKGGDGPRSTPSIDGGRVYVLGARLVLAAYDAKTGKEVWSKDIIKEYGGRIFQWQSAASPVIEGDLIFVVASSSQPGSSLMAFNKKDGSLAWKALDGEKMTHASPIATTVLGVRQVIFYVQSGLISVDPKTGNVLWKFPFQFSVSSAASPVVDGDVVYVSAGYGVGGAAARISKEADGYKATQLWRTKGDKDANHWSTPAAKNGYLYGIYGFKEYGAARLQCMEIATGKVVWSKPDFGPGGVVLFGDNVLALTSDGQIVLAEASPKAYNELGRSKAVAGKCWNTFGVSNGRLYVRSTKEGACLDVSGK